MSSKNPRGDELGRSSPIVQEIGQGERHVVIAPVAVVPGGAAECGERPLHRVVHVGRAAGGGGECLKGTEAPLREYPVGGLDHGHEHPGHGAGLVAHRREGQVEPRVLERAAAADRVEGVGQGD